MLVHQCTLEGCLWSKELSRLPDLVFNVFSRALSETRSLYHKLELTFLFPILLLNMLLAQVLLKCKHFCVCLSLRMQGVSSLQDCNQDDSLLLQGTPTAT